MHCQKYCTAVPKAMYYQTDLSLECNNISGTDCGYCIKGEVRGEGAIIPYDAIVKIIYNP